MSVIEIIRAAMLTPIRPRKGETYWGLNLCLWGPPGTGKTAQVEAIVDHYVDCPSEVLSPGERGEGAFGVTPVPHDGVITYPPPEWVIRLRSGGIVFLDEVNQAPPPLQPAIMGITLARRVGGFDLGARVRTICAANPTDQAAGGWDFAPPVANRMGHLDWPMPDAEGWADWMMGAERGDGTPKSSLEKEESRVLKSWARPWASSVGLVTGFVKARPELLNKMPQMGSRDIGRAWPSSRTWEMATRAMASSTVNGLNDVDRETFVAAFIGEGAANELANYIEKVDLPDPADVLEGKVKFKHDAKRLDRTAAVLGSCAVLVVGMEKTDKKRKDRADALWTILGDKSLLDDAMDIAFLPAKKLVVNGLHATKAAYPVLQKMLPILEAAGIRYDDRKSAEDE